MVIGLDVNCISFVSKIFVFISFIVVVVVLVAQVKHTHSDWNVYGLK